MQPKLSRPKRLLAQRGAATLVVVMLLFFLVSMVAAYASRNLIFEQKTSANQYRATQAHEATEAALEWAVALLNGGRIDASCQASTDVANNRFRERYLDIDPATGRFTPRTWGVAGQALSPSCVRTADENAPWSCSCPAAADPVLAVPVGTGPFPAFRVRFETVDQPGAVRVRATACTRLDNTCLGTGQGSAGEAAATASVVVALASALPTPPSAALTVNGAVNTGAAAIDLRNTDPLTSGLTLNAGGAVNAAGAVLSTVPGSPAEDSVVANDASLPGLAGSGPQRLFSTLLGATKTGYKNQPATVVLSDCATACSTKLRDAVQAHPGRMIWVEGDMTLESDVVLGSAADPVVIVAGGSINLNAPSIQIVGLVYSQAADWNNAGLGAVVVQGAAVAEGNFGGTGTPQIVYDPAVLQRLKLATGSMVRVPGSWNDF